MVDFSKYQTSTKKLPGEKITPGPKDDQKVKIKVEDSESSTLDLNNDQDKKGSKNKSQNLTFENKSMDPHLIDQKINELVNERLLKLVKSGLRHELTQENLLRYIKTHTGTKEYKLADFFDADIHEIKRMVKYLHSTGVIKKDKNNFYHLK
ncbi:MAG: hypothetical protein ACFFDF_24745 [Candidatus Odinarchaeota archaeon]